MILINYFFHVLGLIMSHVITIFLDVQNMKFPVSFMFSTSVPGFGIRSVILVSPVQKQIHTFHQRQLQEQ